MRCLQEKKPPGVEKHSGRGGGDAAHYLERLSFHGYVLAAFLLKSNKQTLQMK